VGDELSEWEKLEQRFNQLFFVLGPQQIPKPDDLERLKLSRLTFGQIPSDVPEMIELGYRFHATDEETQLTLVEAMEALGFAGGAKQSASPFEIVRDGIARRSLSAEFVMAWGTLEYCWGTLRTLQFRDAEATYEFRRRVGGASESTVVHEHWYAQWIAHHAPSFEKQARNDAAVQLSVLCEEISNGERAPSPPYPLEWFARMLERDGHDAPTGELKSTYTKLTISKIKTMLEHPLLTPEVLPPLNPDEFEPISEP
jgi:hypothetical protein